MSYKKVGGLHFIKMGRFGCSFYVSKAAPREARVERHGDGDGASWALLAVLAAGIFIGI